MLLKGHDEVRASPRPLAAADMVLVRLAYAANLPPPGELARRLAGEAGAASDSGPPTSPPRTPRDAEPARAEALNAAPENTSSDIRAPASTESAEQEEPALPELSSFEDVVALTETKRDLKLKHALVEQVRLVRFGPGTIEINPLPHARRELGQELMRKLKSWTGRVWIVAVSDEEGAPPLGVQRREKEAREIDKVREHPSVKQVMKYFPDARITAVRPVAEPAPPPENAEASEDFEEDGTN